MGRILTSIKTCIPHQPDPIEVLNRMPNEVPDVPWVSIIVPVWSDNSSLLALLQSRGASNPRVEWVIAAIDISPALEQVKNDNDLILVRCPAPSRGAQMNMGAACASGRLLCFHHADTMMTPEHLQSLIEVAGDAEIIGGAFHRKFDNRHRWMLRWESIVHRIDRGFGPFFGDQSIFVRADTFRAMGGFADIPLMEDLEFSARMKKEGPIRLLQPPIWSSPRRFQQLGNWRTSAMNAAFIAMYYAGVSPQRLHRWYYSKKFRGSSVMPRPSSTDSKFDDSNSPRRE